MPLIGRERVFPLHHQVQLGDPFAADYPQWEMGRENVVFTTQVLAVATQGDEEGDVQVEVWTEPVGVELVGVPVLETEILLSGDVVQFGNMVAGDLHEVGLRRGWYRVRVLVEPTDDHPSLVRFVLEPSPRPGVMPA